MDSTGAVLVQLSLNAPSALRPQDIDCLCADNQESLLALDCAGQLLGVGAALQFSIASNSEARKMAERLAGAAVALSLGCWYHMYLHLIQAPHDNNGFANCQIWFCFRYAWRTSYRTSGRLSHAPITCWEHVPPCLPW